MTIIHEMMKSVDIRIQAQALQNLSAVLEEAGSSLKNVVKVNIFLSDMTSFAAMNRVYDTFWDEPKPVSLESPSVAETNISVLLDIEADEPSAVPASRSRSCR